MIVNQKTNQKTWALVTNGVHARILCGMDGKTARASIELESKARSTHLGEIMSDKAGRSFASDGDGRRSALEPGSDPVRREMQDFARDTLDLLSKHRRAGEFDRLAVFAAPRMLGILREEMPAVLRDVIVLERASNLVNEPEVDLREAILKAL